MRIRSSESGFTLVELMLASVISMVVMGVAFSTFKDALAANEAVAQLTDSSQNLRAGTNLLIKDLLQVGRNMPTGGIAIPSGLGAQPIHRPSPPGTDYFFDNTDATTIPAITTGAAKGPTVDGRPTDLITLLTMDPVLPELQLWEYGAHSVHPTIATDGSYFDVLSQTAWIQGNPDEGIAPVKAGDLFYFSGAGNHTLMTVTRVVATKVYFETGDPFNLNQPAAAAGNVMHILPTTPYQPGPPESGAAVTVQRMVMLTYYVHEEVAGVPRLMRMTNMFEPQALAGVVEDLEFTFDLVDGVNNPVNIESLPYTANDVIYSANQIRKVNVHLGVRSELKSPRTKDYLRNHLSTVVSLRNLAYVDRYQ